MARSLFGVLLLAVCMAAHPTDSDKTELLSCKGYPCREGHRCFLEDVECSQAPCPKKPKCRPTCPSVPCDPNYTCVDGECYPMTSCEGYKCDDGWECYMQEVQCSHPPCPEAPLCRPTCNVIRCHDGYVCKDGLCFEDICAHTQCKEGYKCIDGHCVKEPTCNGYECEHGEECFLQEVQCIKAPCPPIPSCRPVLTCDTINCLAGYYCADRQCVPIPSCDGVLCESGEECYLQEIPCNSPPCPPPHPTCRKDPCATIRCRDGYICVNGGCILKNTTCVGFEKCEAGEECYLQSIQCFVAPCPPPFPACRPSCATILCLAPSNCVNGQCIPVSGSARIDNEQLKD